MLGKDVKALRKEAGLSQAAFAEALGLSRESIGRIERSSEPVDRRTELAMRYIAEVGLPVSRSLVETHEEVANVLDDAAIRTSPSIERTRRLKAALVDWADAGGSDLGRGLIARAQGIIGMLNVTSQDDLLHGRTVGELLQLKNAWRAIRPDSSFTS